MFETLRVMLIYHIVFLNYTSVYYPSNWFLFISLVIIIIKYSKIDYNAEESYTAYNKRVSRHNITIATSSLDGSIIICLRIFPSNSISFLLDCRPSAKPYALLDLLRCERNFFLPLYPTGPYSIPKGLVSGRFPFLPPRQSIIHEFSRNQAREFAPRISSINFVIQTYRLLNPHRAWSDSPIKPEFLSGSKFFGYIWLLKGSLMSVCSVHIIMHCEESFTI